MDQFTIISVEFTSDGAPRIGVGKDGHLVGYLIGAKKLAVPVLDENNQIPVLQAEFYISATGPSEKSLGQTKKSS